MLLRSDHFLPLLPQLERSAPVVGDKRLAGDNMFLVSGLKRDQLERPVHSRQAGENNQSHILLYMPNIRVRLTCA